MVRRPPQPSRTGPLLPYTTFGRARGPRGQGVDQRGRGGGDDDAVERAVFRPAYAAVVVLAADVEAERAETLARGAQQFADALDRVHFQPQRGQDRGLVDRKSTRLNSSH